MNKYKLLSISTFTALSLWASPAMAQSVGENDWAPPPAESGFAVPREYGNGCSRERPRECTPDQRDRYNELLGLLCNIGGGAVGVVDGFLVTALVGATAVGAPAAPIAGSVHGVVVGAAAIAACYDRFRIPAPQ